MYPLTTELVDFLLSGDAQAALRELAGENLEEQATLSLLTRLRHSFSPAQAAALLDQATLRQRAASKFPEPHRLLYVDEALQQASSREVARYRAAAFASYRQVADLGCGIGADTVALAEQGLDVTAVEIDPVRARIAQANVAALGLAARVQVICGDWTGLDLAVEAAFVDPSRRAGGRRIFRPAEMEPSPAAWEALRRRVPHLAVKTAPGIADDDIPPAAQVEFISERGAMKEALLRFGGLRTGPARRATLLPGPVHLDGDEPAGPPEVSEPRAYLLEPDPAIIRATQVRQLASRLRAAQIDASIAYLTAESVVSSPFARSWRVVRHGPFHLKTLNRWLRELQPGQLVVKKRGSPIDPDSFRRRLFTAPGGPVLTVFLTRVRERPWMIVARDE
jgi:protein-L-isoaspartate O-methyltransferase